MKRIRGHMSEPWPYRAFSFPCIVSKGDDHISLEWVMFHRYHLITVNRRKRHTPWRGPRGSSFCACGVPHANCHECREARHER
jgi:hypothetical protein